MGLYDASDKLGRDVQAKMAAQKAAKEQVKKAQEQVKFEQTRPQRKDQGMI